MSKEKINVEVDFQNAFSIEISLDNDMKTTIDLLKQKSNKDIEITELKEQVAELNEKNEKLEAVIEYITVMTGIEM